MNVKQQRDIFMAKRAEQKRIAKWYLIKATQLNSLAWDINSLEMLQSMQQFAWENFQAISSRIKRSPRMEQTKEQTRVRISFTVSAKGVFQPDVTSEAETVDVAMYNLDQAYQKLDAWAIANGHKKAEEVIG